MHFWKGSRTKKQKKNNEAVQQKWKKKIQEEEKVSLNINIKKNIIYSFHIYYGGAV